MGAVRRAHPDRTHRDSLRVAPRADRPRESRFAIRIQSGVAAPSAGGVNDSSASDITRRAAT